MLATLGYGYHGKNIHTVRRRAQQSGISVDHLPDQRVGPGADRRGRDRYSDEELATAVAASWSRAESLRRLGDCPTGANRRTLQQRTAELGISTDHFDPFMKTA